MKNLDFSLEIRGRKPRVYRPKAVEVKKALFQRFCARCGRLLGFGRSGKGLGMDRCRGCAVRAALEALHPIGSPGSLPGTVGRGGAKRGKKGLLTELEALLSEL